MITENTVQITRLAMPVLKNAGLESRISQHFGKACGFIILNSDGSNCEYLDTKASRRSNECAPIRALVEHGSKVLLCCSMGRGALTRSHEAGLLILQANSGDSVADVLNAFQKGRCNDFPDNALCLHHHEDHE